MANLRKEVEHFCAKIGQDRLLVQGAGGNVSWKDQDTLWIKASGTWLSQAESHDIFVPVNLNQLNIAVSNSDFNVKPVLKHDSSFRASIETLLHALMPQTVVVHVHAVEVLAILVRKTAKEEIQALLGSQYQYLFIDYFKPGAQLAEAVYNEQKKQPEANIVFLKNHGVVIAGETVSEVYALLIDITDKLKNKVFNSLCKQLPEAYPVGYISISDPELHQLANDPFLFSFLKKSWALYPDHVVFLGQHAFIFDDLNRCNAENKHFRKLPELIFVRNYGVFVSSGLSNAKLAQLICYSDILKRQTTDGANIQELTSDEILELLGWDAEKYRMSIDTSKNQDEK